MAFNLPVVFVDEIKGKHGRYLSTEMRKLI